MGSQKWGLRSGVSEVGSQKWGLRSGVSEEVARRQLPKARDRSTMQQDATMPHQHCLPREARAFSQCLKESLDHNGTFRIVFCRHCSQRLRWEKAKVEVREPRYSYETIVTCKYIPFIPLSSELCCDSHEEEEESVDDFFDDRSHIDEYTDDEMKD